MIKLVFALRHRPELSLEDFQAYWRERHAPLVARHAADLGIRRYVQAHARHTGPRRDPARSRTRRASSTLSRSSLWFAEEHVVVEGPQP